MESLLNEQLQNPKKNDVIITSQLLNKMMRPGENVGGFFQFLKNCQFRFFGGILFFRNKEPPVLVVWKDSTNDGFHERTGKELPVL
jgi:hypothetical protein